MLLRKLIYHQRDMILYIGGIPGDLKRNKKNSWGLYFMVQHSTFTFKRSEEFFLFFFGENKVKIPAFSRIDII